MSKRPPSRSTRKKDAAVQSLKSLESKDSKALKYVDPTNPFSTTCMPSTAACRSQRRRMGFCRHVLAPLLRSLSPQPAVDSGNPQLPLGCKATYAPRSGPSDFRGLHCLETVWRRSRKLSKQ